MNELDKTYQAIMKAAASPKAARAPKSSALRAGEKLNKYMASMIGRKIESPWHKVRGEVLKWAPLGPAMTDILVQKEDGGQIWLSSTDAHPTDGKKLPTRKRANELSKVELANFFRTMGDRK